MPSFRDSILANVVQPLMPLLTPSGFDVHTSRVIVRSRLYPTAPGGRDVGLGTPTVTDLEILPRPKVRDAGNQRLRVSLIIPQNANGGYTPAQLKPADADGFEYFYLVIGPDGTERGYTLEEIDTRKPFFYEVELAPLDRKIPF
jgi:hypothetical protein